VTTGQPAKLVLLFISELLHGKTVAVQPSPSACLIRFCSPTLGVLREDNTFVPA
jgi:hypothetical protein